MSVLIADGRNQSQTSLWLHLPNVKKLAKVVKEAAVVLHGRALNGLCRAAGYANYDDALHHPRPLPVSFQEWCRSLAGEFDLEEQNLLPIGELEAWYPRIFVERGWDAAQLRCRVRRGEILPLLRDDAESCELIPEGADHRQTLVDNMQLGRTRTRLRPRTK